MSARIRRRLVVPLAMAGIVGLGLVGCTGDIAAEDAADTDCSDFEQYGTEFDENEVTAAGTIVDLEADNLIASWKDFSTCTGIKISYQGSRDFEGNIAQLAEGGNAPDVGLVPQPGLVALLARNGYLQPAPKEVEANTDKFYSADWKTYGTVDGTFYGAPLRSNLKGFIWYSPSEFKEKGYEIPKTLDELTALTQQIKDDGDHLPWCAGLESGDATGWPATDWVEDFVLRLHGPDVYDQWVTHQIPFNDPRIVEAIDAAGEYLKNPDLIDTESLITTPFQEGGLPILDGDCSLHHQGTFYSAFWPKGTDIGPDGDVYAFLMPQVSADTPVAVEGGGETVVAFQTNDAITAFLTFISSDVFSNNVVKAGQASSANNGVDPENASDPLLVEAIKILQDPNTTFKYDGSDLMPGAVGSNSFWKGMVAWATGESSQQVADDIEASWPAS